MKNVISSRKLARAILAFAAAIALAGCKQDPLADYSKEIRDATPEQKTDDKTDDIKRESMFIDTNEFYHVKEGEELTFEIKGRVLLKDTTYELGVENLSDFKGASFNPVTGVFKWKPAQDTVKFDLQEVFPLKVILLTTNGPVLAQTKTVNIFVMRELAGPSISAAAGLSPGVPFREGGVYFFQVDVKSAEELRGNKPILSVVMNRVGLENGSGFVSLRKDTDNPTQNINDPTLWTFYLQLNLSDADVTPRTGDLYFGLQAYSSFGIPSPVKDFNAKVITSWVEPKVSWSQDIAFTEGKENSYSFTLYDPRDEGAVEGQFPNCQSLGATCKCVTTVRSQANCTITWTPLTAQAGRTYNIKFTGINRATVPGDSTFTRKDFTGLNVKILAAPPPPPPVPTPTATPPPVQPTASEVGGN